VIRRLLLFIPMAAGIVIVTFGLLLLIPGDPAAVLLGQEATPEGIASLRRSLGLDDPWYIRLGGYFWALLHGDMGRSIFQNAPVSAPRRRWRWWRCCGPPSWASRWASSPPSGRAASSTRSQCSSRSSACRCRSTGWRCC